ncbi:MAG: acyl-CoA desaturase [Solirubrobacteraceae bacterium]
MSTTTRAGAVPDGAGVERRIQPAPSEAAAQLSLPRRTINVLAVAIPPVALVVGIGFDWQRGLEWRDLTMMISLYALTILGVTVGYHRLLTHRAFETHRVTRYVLAIIGSMAIEGPVIRWVADHRKHHAFTDRDGDPHSPHTNREPGLLGSIRGLWHAHVGWLFATVGLSDARRYARELVEDRGMRAINRSFGLLALVSLAIPFLAGWLYTGTLGGAAWAFVWAGLVRVFFIHHATWSVNSLAHFAGRRRFDTADESRNVAVLALPTLGEGWHNNHHAFPRSAFHGLRWWEVDISGLTIRALEAMGLAWNVVRISAERQREKAQQTRAAA